MNNDKRIEFNIIRSDIESQLKPECVNCGSIQDLYLHHIVPLVMGGTNRIGNIVWLCGACHSKVHNHDLTDIKNLIKQGKKHLREQGKWSSGIVPFGYTTNKHREIIIDENEAQIVKLLFDWRYEQEKTLTLIMDLLDNLAITTRHENSRWSSSTLKQILESTIYFGGTFNHIEFPSIIDIAFKNRFDSFMNRYSLIKKRPRKYRYKIISFK